MLTDIPNERGKFCSRDLMQSLTKELWHFNFISGFIHVLKSEGIHKKKKRTAFLLEFWACTGTKIFNTNLSRYFKFCYCACWDRPPSWLSCMIQCLRLSGIHSLSIPQPKSPEFWSGKLHSTPNTSWQHEGHTKAQEPQLFVFKRKIISGSFPFQNCSVF